MGGKESKNCQYDVVVKTIEKKYAGTNDNVFLTFIGPDGKRSKTFDLDVQWRDDFEEGERNTFQLEDFHDFGRIDKIEINLKKTLANFISGKTLWGLEWILVVDKVERKVYEFPVHRWMYSGDNRRWSRFDCTLPQHDTEPHQRIRELVEKRDTYKFKEIIPGVTPLLEALPFEENFSQEYKKCIKHVMIENAMVSQLISFTEKAFTSLNDMDSVYKFCYHEPKIISDWRSDTSFGRLQLTGCNPYNIELCTSIPDNFGVTGDMVAHSLGNSSLEKAMEDKRIFISNYGFLHNVSRLHAPVCMYYVNDAEDLIPIAIQLKFAKSESNPVFLPNDAEYTWMLAKLWFSVADANYHEACINIGFTHFVLETIVIAIHRYLSPSHPLFRLIQPHMTHVLNTNWDNRKILFEEGRGYFDQIFNAHLHGCTKIMKNGLSSWSFKNNGMLINNLKERGVLDQKVLPKYYFRDDALLLWDAIYAYVTKIVKNFYHDHREIEEDKELQLFRYTLTKTVASGGCGLKNVPGDEISGVKDVEEIADIFTTIIFIASVNHAAVNSNQYEQFAFPPNFPIHLRGSLPNNKKPRTEEDIVKALPNKEEVLKTMSLTRTLSTFKTNKLGDFEIQYMYNPACVTALKEFRAELKKIGKIIDERNRLRTVPYRLLHPDNVPNSIAI